MKTGGPNRYATFEKHGMTDTPTYNSWVLMHKRCRNKNNPNYGGRGIKVCERWASFPNFLEDMGVRPDGLTLDRIEAHKDYFKENCRWATDEQQANNRKKSILIEFDGKKLSAAQWSRISGIDRHTILNRFHQGMEPKAAIFSPPTPPGLRRWKLQDKLEELYK